MRIQHFQVKNQSGRKTLWAFGFLLFCLWAVASGCALSEQRVHPDFEVKAIKIKQPVLLPPDVSMLEMLPGGLIRQREDWSAAGSQNLQKAILLYLKNQNYVAKPLAVDSRTDREVEEIQSLYRLVHKSMHQQTLHPHRGTQTGSRFEFSLGSIDGLLDKLGGDALIFVSGYDRVSNSGRKAMIELAIADSSGTIFYYSVNGTIQGTDLRDPTSANVMARELLSGFSRISG